MQGRNQHGRFTNKSEKDRSVRSIRATNLTWENFGKQASEQSITRADLLEQLFSQNSQNRVIHEDSSLTDNRVIHNKIDEVLKVLKKAIASKKEGGFYVANNAKALKDEVLSAIAILENINV